MFNPYLSKLKACVFDIETSGLASFKDIVISASFIDAATGDLFQLFTESPDKEKETIEALLAKLSEYDCVITYNGDSFDLPFVLTRAKKYKLTEQYPLLWQIDMYRWLKKYWPASKHMASMRQKMVEEAFGLASKRTDEIGGGECISLYNLYTSTGNKEAKDKILLHNADDVRQLLKITEKANFLPFHQIAYEQGFGAEGPVIFSNINVKDGHLTADAQTEKGFMPVELYEDGYSFSYDTASGKIGLDIILKEKNGLWFIDLRPLGISSEERINTLEGFHSEFLLIKYGESLLYREITTFLTSFTAKTLLDITQTVSMLNI